MRRSLITTLGFIISLQVVIVQDVPAQSKSERKNAAPLFSVSFGPGASTEGFAASLSADYRLYKRGIVVARLVSGAEDPIFNSQDATDEVAILIGYQYLKRRGDISGSIGLGYIRSKETEGYFPFPGEATIIGPNIGLSLGLQAFWNLSRHIAIGLNEFANLNKGKNFESTTAVLRLRY